MTTYVHDLQELIKTESASAGLLVYTAKQPTQEDLEYAKDHRITIWGESELSYFESVADAIGTYARYEICHALGIETAEEKQITNVLAVRFRQPTSGSGHYVYMFSLTPEKLLKTCVLYRRAQGNPDAYQRMLRKNRLASVKRFVTRSDALLPPSVIVHLGSQVRWEGLDHPKEDKSGKTITLTNPADYELGVLEIPLGYASLELIDGQHRLYGFVETEPATKRAFNLSVIGLQDLPIAKRRDTFIAINDNSRRMDPNLVAYLKYTEDEDERQKDPEIMAIGIAVDLNKLTPFRDRIRLLDVGGHKITLKGISGYDLKSLLGPRGLLRKYYANDTASYISALRLYFGIVASTFAVPWSDPDRYIISTNRGLSAFLKLLKSLLRTSEGKLTEATVKKYIGALLAEWPDKEWDTAHLRSSYVGSKGWSDFHRDLVSAIQKTHSEFVG